VSGTDKSEGQGASARRLRSFAQHVGENRAILVVAFVHAAFIDLTYLVMVGERSYEFLALSLIANTVLLATIFYWIASFRYGRTLILPAIFFIDFMILYASHNFRIPIDANSVAVLAETDLSEAREFFSVKVLYWSLGALLVGLVTYLYLHRDQGTQHRLTRLSGSALAVVTAAALWDSHATIDPATYQGPMPVTVAMAMTSYAWERAKLKFSLTGREDISLLPVTAGGDDIDIVLIIGESSRGASFELNGYTRPTNPQLKTLGVISYPNTLSCAALTRISVPCLMTRATVADHEDLAKETSLVSVFARLGFNTAWFSNQRLLGKSDSLVFSFAAEAAFKKFNEENYWRRKDSDILPEVLSYLSVPAARRLTVFHTIGSHWSYKNRYDQKFAVYKPVCRAGEPADCPVQSVINAYDNSILATDDLIAQVIRAMSGRTAFVIFVADHGESLGEDGYYQHSIPSRPEQRNVPFIFWASDSYKAKFPERYKAALAKLQVQQSHDAIFHSMLGCAGIAGEVVDNHLSICAP
jgi:lipid A ethanolaminephosphotransferase